MDEKWLIIEIGGYRRSIPESKLEKVYEEAEKIKQELMQKGVKHEIVENLYTIRIVKNDK